MFTYKPQTAKNNFLRFLLLMPLLLSGALVSAQPTTGTPPPSIWDNPLALTMLAVIIVLLLVIALLANVVLGTAGLFINKEKKKTSAVPTKTITILLLLLAPLMGLAQEEAVVATSPTSIGGLSATTFWLLAIVIMVELLVIIVLGLFVKSFLTKEKAHTDLDAVEKKTFSFNEFWEKFNKFKPIEQETNIDLGHEYDGIRELDNRLPPWWLYGFYLCILIAGIYMWRYHIAETAPLSKQEFEIAMQKAEEQKAAYLAKTASNVDENTVVYLNEPAALNAAKNNFVQMCAACHGKEGQGGVGPNLTDDYWINGGSLSDIFKVIKYGRPEKGMKSWQDDYSPVQIAQLSSYIKSLHGTKPPNPKEPQGDLYKEAAPKADSTATANTTTK